MFFPVALVKLIKQVTKGSRRHGSDQAVPPGMLNWIFLQLQLVENDFFEILDFPIGTSIFIVAQKRR